MGKGKLQIHSENILPIIKKWLYSDHDIFLRELVSNSCDALSKVNILGENKTITLDDSPFRIDIKIDPENKKVVISDNGIGMTAEEVKKYIAQLAFSGAEEFVKKYQSDQEQIIGHFGLGFYSAFMVSEQVEIDTLSYQEGAESAYWVCDGGSTYTLKKGTRTTRGTSITLSIGEGSEEYLEETRLRTILSKYCAYLPFPIYLEDTHINHKDPLWLKQPSACTEEEYTDFYRELYPTDPPPIFWVHLNVDYPFHLKGILYFPKITERFDHSSSNIKLFCNRVFVSDNCKEIFPAYLTVLRGALDSPDIPLNVSRSYLQMDRTVKQLAQHISKKISDRLSTLYNEEREKFLTFWPDMEVILKMGILQDEKFYERCKSFLVWKTLTEDWMTPHEYAEKHPHKIFYTNDTETSSPCASLYREQNIPVLVSSHPIDSAVMSFLEKKGENIKFQRIDGGTEDLLIDASREKNLLDASGRSESARIASTLSHLLQDENVEVEAKSLTSDTVPCFIVIDEEMRRMRDYFSLSQQDVPEHLMGKRKFIINTNNPLIQAICDHQTKKPELARQLTQHLYDLALLAQRELKPDQLNEFVKRSTSVLTSALTADQEVSSCES